MSYTFTNTPDEPTDDECREWLRDQPRSVHDGIAIELKHWTDGPHFMRGDTESVNKRALLIIRAMIDKSGWKRPVPTVVKPSDEWEEVCALPGGYTLYVMDNKAGGRSYYSDEIDGGVLIYDTCLHSRLTVMMALVQEDLKVVSERKDK